MRHILTLLFLATFSPTFGQKLNSADKPINVVKKVFDDYVKYFESTDNPDDKEAITKALKSLQDSCEERNLPLLINVWMYYDPTDFPTRELVEPIFYKNRSAAIKAIDKRIASIKEWEDKEASPYTDLFYLKDELLKDKTKTMD